MRVLDAEYGEAEIEGLPEGAVLTLDRTKVAALVKKHIGSSLADPHVAADLTPVFGWFALSDQRLQFARTATFPDNNVQSFALDPTRWPFFAKIRISDDELGTISRELRPKNREVRHWRLALEDDYQGDGTGRSMLARAQLLYDALSLRRITLTAAGSVGAELWARVGFKFTAKERRRVELELEGFAERLEFFPQLPEDWDAREVHDLVATDGEDRSIGTLLRLMNPEAASVPELWDAAFVGPLRNNKVNVDIPRPLGHAALFLLGEWEGIVDLEDEWSSAEYRAFLAK